MEGYLGEFEPSADHPYLAYTPTDWAVEYIESYGQIHGDHHMAWVLDQVARILKGGMVPKVVIARWLSPIVAGDLIEEVRFSLHDVPETRAYADWVTRMRGEWDDDNEDFEYGYDVGIAP